MMNVTRSGSATAVVTVDPLAGMDQAWLLFELAEKWYVGCPPERNPQGWIWVSAWWWDPQRPGARR